MGGFGLWLRGDWMVVESAGRIHALVLDHARAKAKTNKADNKVRE